MCPLVVTMAELQLLVMGVPVDSAHPLAGVASSTFLHCPLSPSDQSLELVPPPRIHHLNVIYLQRILMGTSLHRFKNTLKELGKLGAGRWERTPCCTL